jgi:hypothetical protein
MQASMLSAFSPPAAAADADKPSTPPPGKRRG